MGMKNICLFGNLSMAALNLGVLNQGVTVLNLSLSLQLGREDFNVAL
jgi:hypothetical protein